MESYWKALFEKISELRLESKLPAAEAKVLFSEHEIFLSDRERETR